LQTKTKWVFGIGIVNAGTEAESKKKRLCTMLCFFKTSAGDAVIIALNVVI
jgi:hypothetical protein